MTVFQDKYTLSKGRFVEEMQLEPAFMPKCRNFASDKANIGLTREIETAVSETTVSFYLYNS